MLPRNRFTAMISIHHHNLCRSVIGILGIVTGLLSSGVASGQDEIQTQIAAEPGPYFVGLPVTIQLTAAGVSGRGEPEVIVEVENDALQWKLTAANPTSIRFNNNGRVTSQTKYDFVFRFTAGRAGKFDIGPFVIKDGSLEQRVDAVKINFEDVPTTDDMKINLRLPEGPYFPEQRVPVEVQWWYAGELANTGVSISSPLFDKFTFEDEKPSNVRQALLPIDTAEGSVDLQATVREEQVDGKLFRVFTAKRMMIPDRTGTFQIDPIQVTIRRRVIGRRERRDDAGFGFGFFDRVEEYVKSVDAFRAVGEPLTIEVGGFPEANRPESFAGAVGKGFSIDVSADRTVVRVGDPIRLNVRLRGSGNLRGAGLPPLSADGGLDPQKFRLPVGDVTGEFSKGEKTFSVSVRVADESVSEIPSIAYSWFDTDAKQYRTARSSPIALRVMPANVISADDVVAAGKAPAKRESASDVALDSPPSTETPAAAKTFSLSGADLAIEPNPAALLSNSATRLSPMVVQTGSYFAGVALILVALIDRRRSRIDPQLVRRRQVIRRQGGVIAAAADKPQKQAAAEIAAALRAMLAAEPEIQRAEVESVISQCEAVVYQPTAAGDDRISPQIIQQATALAQRFRREAR